VLKLSVLVAFPPGVRGADVNRGDLVRSEQSRERVLGDRLSAPAGPPFGPGPALDPVQLVSESFRRDLLKAIHDLPDSCESFLE
jgi:hypothetical protein